ncbi:MAG: NAD(P)/FAD-dependent oxidoreductase, partial [Chitinophagaceae bacterium]
GGLAGLSLAIQAKAAGLQVALFEKETYPFHRVCGEYISMESFPFIESLGLPLGDMELPRIKRLQVSAPNGKLIEQELPLGGFGISRYLLDYRLSVIAKQNGVQLFENAKVFDIQFENNKFNISTQNGAFSASAVAGTFGKRSNLDIKWQRPFTSEKPTSLNNYIGVKYHVITDFPYDMIALHNFENGYCGISAVEEGKYCLCYMTTAENLQKNNHSIKEMEKNVLFQNPHLKKIFLSARFERAEPVTISQISFEKKGLLENHVLMVGDAAGMITPLCGNGMSMALHGSKIAAGLLIPFLKGEMSRDEMEMKYEHSWNAIFAGRLRTGRRIQSLFGKPALTNVFLSVMNPFPSLISKLIRQTHGEPF